MQRHQDREDGQLDEPPSYAQRPRLAASHQAYSHHASSSYPDHSRQAYDRRDYETRAPHYERRDDRRVAAPYEERHWSGSSHQHHHHQGSAYAPSSSSSYYAESNYHDPRDAYNPNEARYEGYTPYPAAPPQTTADVLDQAPVWNGHAPKVGTQMRLVALESDVLPEGQKVAIVDARDEGVSIGRDRSFTARIRLPSMSISKHHANLFLMPAITHDAVPTWSVTDAGSTHGSFHLSAHAIPPRACAKDIDSKRFTRLSEPKKASAPHALHHGDWLRFGSGTTFEVHLHGGGGAWACAQCSLTSDGASEIPLKASAETTSAAAMASTGTIPLSAAAAAGAAFLDASVIKPDTSSGKARAKIDRKVELEAQRRQKMRQMREQFLGEDTTKVTAKAAAAAAASQEGTTSAVLGEEDSSASSTTPKYIDRAAARRARNPDGPIPKRWNRRRSASPPSSSAAATAPGQRQAFAQPARLASPPSPPKARAAPLNASNVGFRMLQQMTGGASPASATTTNGSSEAAPSTSTGISLGSSGRFAEAIVVRGTEGRAGLGSAVLRDAEEIGAQRMGVAWASTDGKPESRGAGAIGGSGSGRGGYGGKDATRRRYEMSLRQGGEGTR